MTAYRQQALACAVALQVGPLRPRDLSPIAPEAGRILLRNVYGWFDRVGHGLYQLSEPGKAALLRWPVTIEADELPAPATAVIAAEGNAN